MTLLHTFLHQYGQRITAIFFLSLVVFACADHTDPQQPVVNCKLSNGTDRPYPCEFVIEKLIFLAKDGTTIREVLSGSPNITLPISKAKTNTPNAGGGSVTYDVKAVVRRQNAPSFPVTSGYILSSTFVTVPLQSDPRPVITSTQLFPMAIGATQEATFNLSFSYSLSGGVPLLFVGPREFFIENDVTTTKFPFIVSVTVEDKAEASMKIAPAIVN